MLKTFDHFSDWARSELDRRTQANPRYSLQSFSRQTGLSPSFLSRLLNKKTGLSPKKAWAMGEKMGLSIDELEYLSDLARASFARTTQDRKIAKLKLRSYDTRYNSLSLDEYHLISQWYHFAIMELTLVKGFKRSPEWIAERLGIRADQAETAIERMLRVGILIEEGGRLKPALDYVLLPKGAPDEITRNAHREILGRALKAVDEQSNDERDVSTVIFRMKKSDFELAATKMKKARRKLTQTLEATSEPDSVYALSMQLFRLDRGNQSE